MSARSSLLLDPQIPKNNPSEASFTPPPRFPLTGVAPIEAASRLGMKNICAWRKISPTKRRTDRERGSLGGERETEREKDHAWGYLKAQTDSQKNSGYEASLSCFGIILRHDLSFPFFSSSVCFFFLRPHMWEQQREQQCVCEREWGKGRKEEFLSPFRLPLWERLPVKITENFHFASHT